MTGLAATLLRRLRALVDLGTRGKLPAEARRVRVVNVLAVTATVVATPYTALYGIAGLDYSFYGNLAYQAALAAIPFVHRLGWNAGSLVLATTSAAAVGAPVCFIGPGYGLQLYYFIFPAVGFLIFDRRWLAVGFAGVAFACFAVASLLFGDRAADFPLNKELSYLATAAFTILIIGATIVYAFLQVEHAEAVAESERRKSESVLLNILPAPIVERLKLHPNAMVADGFGAVTMLFADIVAFTPRTHAMAPDRLVAFLNRIFTEFDGLADRHGLEKIKTIGDAYMVAAGIPSPRADHVEAVADMALDMIAATQRLGLDMNEPLQIRIGIHTGPAIAGVIGARKFAYDVWGHTVNMAARMESHGVPGRIHVTQAVRDALVGGYAFEARGLVEVKGVGPMETWYLVGKRATA